MTACRSHLEAQLHNKRQQTYSIATSDILPCGQRPSFGEVVAAYTAFKGMDCFVILIKGFDLICWTRCVTWTNQRITSSTMHFEIL